MDSPLSRLREAEFFPEYWKTLLQGVVAFVDVRSGSDNRSKSVANELERLGAAVVTHFSKKVTHMIFKDGSKPIWDKAKALGIPIVSYLWIVACKTKGEIVPTEEHPAINSQDYDSPYFKWRKVKSMQPKDFEEELKLAERKLDRRRKRLPSTLPEKSSEDILLPYTPISERRPIIDVLIESSPMVQERIQQELASGKTCDEVFKVKEGEEDDFDTFFDTPLMLKFISKNYYSPREPPPSSVRRILSEVRRNSTTNATPITSSFASRDLGSGENPKEGASALKKLNSPLSPANNAAISASKRKKRISMSELPTKRRKENEEIFERVPRRRILFQSNGKSLLPQEPIVALTPDESPKKSQNSHPCFTLAGKFSQTELIQRKRRSVRRKSCSPIEFGLGDSPRRDSLADFKLPSPKKRKEPKIKTIACTSVHSDTMLELEECFQELGGYKLVESVDDDTTHIICGDSRRTLNVMRGVIRGLHLVTIAWVLKSRAAGKWVNEADYPVERFSAAAALHRNQKRFLFRDFSPIYVSSKSKVPSDDLCDMIKAAGGHLTISSKKATLVIGQYKPQLNVPCVAGKWILDCIEQGKTLPLTDYLIQS